ncbi:MAG: class I SAM-dependent methyltransferase [Deltaproteobacteria bacterium]|nr:class I SAM-dependent methyltransferase [Deltaproteobacteria bacterium]
MKKIYTTRDIPEQQAYMWNEVKTEDEVSVCQQRRINDYFFKYLTKGEPILEAGCGPGTWVIYLRDKGFDVQGIEHDERIISRIKKDMPSLPVQSGDICLLPFQDSSLGAYISLGVIEHFEDGVEHPLKEALRVLRPGGILILTVPFNNIFRKLVAHPLRSLYLFAHRLRHGKTYFAEYRYSEDEVCEMVKKAGFEIVEIGTDDYNDNSRSMVFWSEFPLLRDKMKPPDLNIVGNSTAFILNSISKKILAAGILIVAQKPL